MHTLVEFNVARSDREYSYVEARVLKFTSVDKAVQFLEERGFKKYTTTGKASRHFYRFNCDAEYLLLEESSISVDPE